MDSLYIHSNHSKKNAVIYENGEYKEKIDIGSTYNILDGDIYKALKLIQGL